ncbi:MAG: terminase family protein [Sphaerochaeta sp.]|nr:terminase family protein [Sphaerochaeta sp.]
MKASSIASLPEQERAKVIQSLSNEEALSLLYDWSFWARDNQLPPTDFDWFVWLLLAGRGFGKTRPGNEQVISWAKSYSPIALVGQTKADVRDTVVELGDSSILKISPPWFMPEYEPSKRRLTWPNGAQAVIYSGDEPDQLRGPQHAKAFVDELCKFKYPQDTWDNLIFGLRVGDKPQVVVATTPRPIPTLKQILADPRTVKSVGHTLENRANLPASFIKYVLDKYEGTRLGRQELAGEVLSDNPNALWRREWLEQSRITNAPALSTVAVGVDPEASNTETSAETGIIGAGVANVGDKKHGYILEDASLRGSPREWATAAITLYYKLKANYIVAEVNQGGDMVEAVIHSVDPNVMVKKIHASRGKELRAEPVSALYEQGRVHHVGFFPDLEDQLCEWVPGEKSPDRLDAAVHVITELMISTPQHDPLRIG